MAPGVAGVGALTVTPKILTGPLFPQLFEAETLMVPVTPTVAVILLEVLVPTHPLGNVQV